MAEAVAARAEHPVVKKGVVTNTLNGMTRVLGLLLLSAFISVCIEWIGMSFYYPDEGYHHAERMLQKEIGYLSGALEADSLNEAAVETASEKVDGVVTFLFIDSGIVGYLQAATVYRPGDDRFTRLVKRFVNSTYDYLMAAIYIISMFFVRLSILILSMPAFILFGMVGMADGLMQRDMRKWCGGNESGFVYHWAKKFAMPTLILAWVIYLAIPNSIHPNLIITPFAVLFGLVLMVMASKFKKYL